ncbi:hypothetical protein ACTJJ0_28395 [Chitinophaga sp. 22321]|uniref:Uncharacterized protein n=1 Tax=Chitinophaga hostae TaxID=2831022 RepID=A0ABS5J989_9BACT|nr:hypothetical protein [Chitinophaga hostae]MBS0031645.1 hypothetical protein [Chitinophaga hostae]
MNALQISFSRWHGGPFSEGSPTDGVAGSATGQYLYSKAFFRMAIPVAHSSIKCGQILPEQDAP